MGSMGWGLFVLGAALGLSASGCYAPADSSFDEDENVGSIEQNFTASQCSTAVALATSSQRFSYRSSTNYGTACNALDVQNMHVFNKSNVVAYTGTLPTTESSCKATYLRAVLYTNTAGTQTTGAWVVEKDVSSVGVWSGSSCSVKSINFGRLKPLFSYRIAATARTDLGGTFLPFFTQELTVDTAIGF